MRVAKLKNEKAAVKDEIIGEMIKLERQGGRLDLEAM